MTPRLVQPSVEGFGETRAVPELLRRLFTRGGHHARLRALDPIRIGHSGSRWLTIKASAERREAIRLIWQRACSKVRPDGCILVFLDLDDDLPCIAAPKLREDLLSIDDSIPFEILFAVHEFETWFLHAAESLQGYLPDLGKSEIRLNARDAKGELAKLMGRKYEETADQLAFARDFCMDQAMSCPSFARLVRKLAALAEQ